MDLNINKQEKQPLLSRTAVIAEITFEGQTPSRYDLVQAISKKLKTKSDLTLVKHIYTEFGSQKAKIEAYIYEDKKVMAVLEKKIRAIKEPKKPEPKVEAPAEIPAEPAAEPKTEEPKETAPEAVKEE
ncbi:MAG: hypothetical protein KAQ83_01835 [Nanoarchaeota archaeon]|nr:hypothetical protein [Nanoarchaeota archaeon]